MLNYNKYFNGKDTYDYPFTSNVEFFTVLGDTMGSVLSNEDFKKLEFFFKRHNINSFSVYKKSYKESRYKYSGVFYLNKFDPEVFGDDFYGADDIYFLFDNGLVFSSNWEGFMLIGGKRKMIEEIIDDFGEEEFMRRATDFIEEWEYNIKNDSYGYWMLDLIKRDNFIFRNETGD